MEIAQKKTGYTDINLNFSGLGYRDSEKVLIFEISQGYIRDVTTQGEIARK